jgi:TfoX/Sxy family transcriptional regulator of competence genes
MATDASFAEYVLEQIALPRRAEARRMFGEYALYVDGKVVALLCDDQLFLKPLEALRARLARVDEAPPYPGAKPHFRIADELERPAELVALLVEAARLLPAKPERKAKSASRSLSKAQSEPTSKAKPKPSTSKHRRGASRTKRTE